MLRISAFPQHITSPNSDVRSRIPGGALIDVLHLCAQVSLVMTPMDTFCWSTMRSLPLNQIVCLYLYIVSRVPSERSMPTFSLLSWVVHLRFASIVLTSILRPRASSGNWSTSSSIFQWHLRGDPAWSLAWKATLGR